MKKTKYPCRKLPVSDNFVKIRNSAGVVLSPPHGPGSPSVYQHLLLSVMIRWLCKTPESQAKK
jgi:hypothetical protein